MDIDIIFKIAGVGIIITVVNQILSKNGRAEHSTLVTIVGIIIVLMVVVETISNLFETLKATFNFY